MYINNSKILRSCMTGMQLCSCARTITECNILETKADDRSKLSKNKEQGETHFLIPLLILKIIINDLKKTNSIEKHSNFRSHTTEGRIYDGIETSKFFIYIRIK